MAAALRLPPVAEELALTFCQGTAGRRATSAPGSSSGGRGASRLPHCVHTRERPPPPSFPRLPRPGAPLVVGSGGPGSPGRLAAAAARGQGAERGAQSAPLARANLEEVRLQLAPRHSLSGALSAPALALAGAAESRGGRPSPHSPGPEGRRDARLRLPTRALGLPASAVPGWCGAVAGCLLQICGGLCRYGGSAPPRLLSVARAAGDTPATPRGARAERGLARAPVHAEPT